MGCVHERRVFLLALIKQRLSFKAGRTLANQSATLLLEGGGKKVY